MLARLSPALLGLVAFTRCQATQQTRPSSLAIYEVLNRQYVYEGE